MRAVLDTNVIMSAVGAYAAHVLQPVAETERLSLLGLGEEAAERRCGEVPRVRTRGFAGEGDAMYAANDMSRGMAG